MAELNIQMKLVSVNEVSFMMAQSKVGEDFDPATMQMGFTSQVQPDVEKDIFALVFGVRYDVAGETVLESIYKFVFEVKDLKQFVVFNDDKSVTVNHIMPHLLNVAVGTMRGILVVKTAGTVLSKFPLPMIDVARLNTILSTSR